MRRMRYRRLEPSQRRAVRLTLAVVLAVSLCGAVLLRLRPIVIDLAVAQLSGEVSAMVAQSVQEAIDSGQADYAALVQLERDEAGRVAVLQSNLTAFNRLQAHIADDIHQRLSSLADCELSIPLGNLSGSPLLAGRGPALRVRMQAVGSVSAALRNSFAAAGINQTRHQILLEISVNLSILLPGCTAAAQVSDQLAVAETIIVGSVPESYTYYGAETP